MIIYIVLSVIGIIILGLTIWRIDGLVESWIAEVLHHTKLINDLDHKRFDDSCRLDKAFERIQALEDKIKDLEETVEHPDVYMMTYEPLEVLDPEDEEIII